MKDQTIEPVYPKRYSLSKLDEFEELLTSWLKREMKRPKKQLKTVKNLFQNLVPLGYSCSYDRVASFARKWREEQKIDVSKRTYMTLEFAPGEAFQFEWGENWTYINGHKTKLQVAHFKLIAVHFSFVTIILKVMKRCLMPITTPSACSKAFPSVVSTII